MEGQVHAEPPSNWNFVPTHFEKERGREKEGEGESVPVEGAEPLAAHLLLLGDVVAEGDELAPGGDGAEDEHGGDPDVREGHHAEEGATEDEAEDDALHELLGEGLAGNGIGA